MQEQLRSLSVRNKKNLIYY